MRKLYFHAKGQIFLQKGICLKDSMLEKGLKDARTALKKSFNFSKPLYLLLRKLSPGKWPRHSTDAYLSCH